MQEAEQDAAKAFAEFKEYYDESPTKVKSFVRGDVIQQGDDGRVTNVASGLLAISSAATVAPCPPRPPPTHSHTHNIIFVP